MFTLTIHITTGDELQQVVNLLNGVEGVTLDQPTAEAPKKATNTTKGVAATKAAMPATAPKKAAGKAAREVSVDDLKAHIQTHAGTGPEANENIKTFVRSFGVAKISDLSAPQRVDAFDKAEAHFAALGGEAEAENEDPMA